MLRELKIQHPTPCIDFKGVIPSFNFSLIVINTFVLVLPKTVFTPSPFISYCSKDFPKQTLDLELPFKSQLSQSGKQYFYEVGRVHDTSTIETRLHLLELNTICIVFKIIMKIYFMTIVDVNLILEQPTPVQ